MTPKKITITPLRGGSRNIVLSCACAKIGRLITSWESDQTAVAELQADHHRMAPRCPHSLRGDRG